MSQIVKTKFLCRSGSRILVGLQGKKGIRIVKRGTTLGGPWEDRFIEGRWYDGQYQTWSFEDGFRINGGWRRYWVINEQGKKEEISRAHFRVIFETDVQQLRDRKIEDIIK